jgi:hypothetical protein
MIENGTIRDRDVVLSRHAAFTSGTVRAGKALGGNGSCSGNRENSCCATPMFTRDGIDTANELQRIFDGRRRVTRQIAAFPN